MPSGGGQGSVGRVKDNFYNSRRTHLHKMRWQPFCFSWPQFNDWPPLESNMLKYHVITTWLSRIGTHVKISHLVASLPTSCQQVVFALLVPRCQQVWNKLLTNCNNLVDIITPVARLFQQVRYSHDITILLQPCVVNLWHAFLLYHDCIRLVRTTL
jgi:hypothetical protein